MSNYKTDLPKKTIDQCLILHCKLRIYTSILNMLKLKF